MEKFFLLSAENNRLHSIISNLESKIEKNLGCNYSFNAELINLNENSNIIEEQKIKIENLEKEKLEIEKKLITQNENYYKLHKNSINCSNEIIKMKNYINFLEKESNKFKNSGLSFY